MKLEALSSEVQLEPEAVDAIGGHLHDDGAEEVGDEDPRTRGRHRLAHDEEDSVCGDDRL